MDNVYAELGEEVANNLKANGIDSEETFLLLTQSLVMTTLNLKLGSWLKIDQMQKNMRDNTPAKILPASPLNEKNELEDDIDKNRVIEILNSNKECQTLVHGKLAEGTTLKRKEKNLICRTLCSEWFYSLIMQGKSVTVRMKEKLAQSIVEAYDCLKVDAEGKPAESEFFWKHNGRNTGEHTGYIQNWVRNKQTKAPTALRRKRRAVPDLSEDAANAIEQLTTLDENEDYENVSELMITTFTYRQELRRKKYTPAYLCMNFPHLLWHGNIMIDEEFERMFPARKAIGTLSTISPFCMMLDHSYAEIACTSVQALLKLMAELKAQGNIKKADPAGLPPLEEYASVFIRWLQPDTDLEYVLENAPGEQPFILCSTMAFAEENYFVIVMGTSFDCGAQFDHAFDLLIKAYKVFNVDVPGKAKKLSIFLI
nr:uncharacterized protein LOC115261822 [Aedes albopictus]